MKKVKFYSSLALFSLSASLLVACSSNKEQVTISSSEQTVQTSTSSSETTAKKTSKSTTKSSSQGKQNKKTTSSSQSAENQANLPNSSEQVGQELLTETQAEIAEQPIISYQESIETNPIMVPEPQQVVEQEIGEVATDYPVIEPMTQEELEANAKAMIDRIPQIAEAHLNPEVNGLGGWYTPEFVAELERQGYYEKLNAAIAELEATRTNNQ